MQNAHQKTQEEKWDSQSNYETTLTVEEVHIYLFTLMYFSFQVVFLHMFSVAPYINTRKSDTQTRVWNKGGSNVALPWDGSYVIKKKS